MKSSLPEADRHDENITLWDDYRKCDLLLQAGIPSEQ